MIMHPDGYLPEGQFCKSDFLPGPFLFTIPECDGQSRGCMWCLDLNSDKTAPALLDNLLEMVFGVIIISLDLFNDV